MASQFTWTNRDSRNVATTKYGNPVTVNKYLVSKELLTALSEIDARGESSDQGELFTYKQLIFLLKEYVEYKKLSSPENPLIIKCAEDPLYHAFNVPMFSIIQVPDLIKQCITLYHPTHNTEHGRKRKRKKSSSFSEAVSSATIVIKSSCDSDNSDVESIQSKDTIILEDTRDEDFVLVEDSPSRSSRGCSSRSALSVHMNNDCMSVQFTTEPQNGSYATDAMFDEEYEVISISATPDKSHQNISESELSSSDENDVVIVCEDSEIEFWADSESSSDSSNECDMAKEDYWSCPSCETSNVPTRGVCDLCREQRPGWYNNKPRTLEKPEHPQRSLNEDKPSCVRRLDDLCNAISDHSSVKRPRLHQDRYSLSTDSEQVYFPDNDEPDNQQNSKSRASHRSTKSSTRRQRARLQQLPSPTATACGLLNVDSVDGVIPQTSTADTPFQFDISEALKTYLTGDIVVHPPDRPICHTLSLCKDRVRCVTDVKSSSNNTGELKHDAQNVNISDASTTHVSNVNCTASCENDVEHQLCEGSKEDRKEDKELELYPARTSTSVSKCTRDDSGIDVNQSFTSSQEMIEDILKDDTSDPSLGTSEQVHITKYETRTTLLNYQVIPKSEPIHVHLTPPKETPPRETPATSPVCTPTKDKNECGEHADLYFSSPKSKRKDASIQENTHNNTKERLSTPLKPNATTPSKIKATFGNTQDACVLCLNAPKEASLIHGNSGHQICCYKCAKKLRRRGKPCPVCRKKISKVIRNYVV